MAQYLSKSHMIFAWLISSQKLIGFLPLKIMLITGISCPLFYSFLKHTTTSFFRGWSFLLEHTWVTTSIFNKNDIREEQCYPFPINKIQNVKKTLSKVTMNGVEVAQIAIIPDSCCMLTKWSWLRNGEISSSRLLLLCLLHKNISPK